MIPIFCRRMQIIRYSAFLLAGPGAWLCSQNSAAQPALELVRQVRLSEEYPVGSVRFIDIDDEGQLLLSDGAALKALLFKQDGQFIRSLESDECHPGAEWTVLTAKFVFGDRILAVNATGRSLFFDANGECIGAAHEDFYPMLDFCTFSGGQFIYGISKHGPGLVVRKMTDSGEPVQDSEAIPTKFPMIDSLVDHESIICDDDSGHIRVVLGSTSTVYSYDQNLDFKGAVLHPFPGQKIPMRDADSRSPGSLLEGVRHLFGQEGTLTSFARNLGEGRILMQHRRYPEYVVQIVRGDTVIYESVSETGVDSASKHGYVIKILYGESDQAGIVPNPQVGLYQLVGQ